MPRLTSPSPDHDHIGDVLDAADAWRDQCFMTDGSLFGEEALWTITNIQVLKELTSRVIDYPIEGEDFSFPEQIEESLKSAPSEVIRLAAEAVWLLLLCPRHGSATPNSKRERIRKIWGLVRFQPAEKWTSRRSGARGPSRTPVMRIGLKQAR